MLCSYAKLIIQNATNRAFTACKYSEYTFKFASCLELNPTSFFSKPPSKGFHTAKELKARVFKDVENVYAYNILKSMPVTLNQELLLVPNPNSVCTSLEDFNRLLDQNWRSKSASDIVDCFTKALNYCSEHNIPISDSRFDKLVDGLMDHVQELTDSELSQFMQCLIQYPQCETYTDHNFHDVWSALDDICCWKMAKWSNETMFLFADYWFRMNLGKMCNYTVRFVDRLSRRARHLSKSELVRAFFFLNVCRKKYVDVDFETALEKYIYELNVDEMAIVAMGFFKSQSLVKLKFLLDRMIKETKLEADSVHEITLTALLKVLRYSSHVLLIDQLMDLLDTLSLEIDRFSNVCCVHIALLGTTLQFFHEESLKRVAHKIVKDIKDPKKVRLKDMERLLLALTMFDFNPKTEPDIFETIHGELHKDTRRAETVMFARSLQSTLHFLSLRKIYSYELMNEILDRDFIQAVYGKYPKGLAHNVISLDTCIEIECPDYKGNRLDKTVRAKAIKWHMEYTPSRNQSRKLQAADLFYLDVMETTSKLIGGHEKLQTQYVLPNFVKADIIVCKDSQGNFVPPTGFERYNLGDVMRIPHEELKWFAIVPINWNNAIRNTSRPLGLMQMKCRQLKAIGFEPIMVIWNEFKALNDREKLEYISNRINAS